VTPDTLRPEASSSDQSPMQSGERSGAEQAHAPLTEESRIKEARGTPAPDAETQPGRKDMTRIAIEIDEDLRSLLSPTHVQIDSPRRIEGALLRPFQAQSQKLLLLPGGKDLIQATLDSLHDTYLIAGTNEVGRLGKVQDRVLPVVFPVLPQRYYVVQTRIDELYRARVKLRYQDPRYDVRRTFQLAAPISLRLAPPVIITAITQKQVRIVRELSQLAEEGQDTGQLADLLQEPHSAALSAYMRLWEDTPALSCGLKDISCGGVCLTLAGAARPEELVQGLALLQIPLPAVTATAATQQEGPYTLTLLGVIRGVRTTLQPWTLHIRFLRRLPEEFGAFFEHLERSHLAGGRQDLDNP
jgi:hypothetical protein